MLGSLFTDLSKEVPEQYYTRLFLFCQEWIENHWIKQLLKKYLIFIKLNIDFMKIKCKIKLSKCLILLKGVSYEKTSQQ